jgi:branched-chain amino acid transport system permease protein
MTGQPVFAQVIVTMGISVAVLGIVAVYWGFAPLPLAAPFDGPPVHIGGTVVNQFNLVSTVFTVVVISAVALFFEYTPVGLQMRAAAESATLASRRGVNLQKVYLLAWVLAGAVAGLAGVLIAFRSNGATPILEAVGLRAFPAALIGGFESLKGAALGALFVGLAQTYATLLWGANVQDAVVFGLMLVFLMMRPYGLFGTREVLRV